jgi:hypothetical protein
MGAKAAESIQGAFTSAAVSEAAGDATEHNVSSHIETATGRDSTPTSCAPPACKNLEKKMLNWAKAIFVIFTPLFVLLVGFNVAVFAGCGIAYLGQSTNGTERLLGLIPIPEPARYTVNAAFLVVNIGAVVLFLWRSRVPLKVARRNNLTLKAFALLPLRERRALMQSVETPRR